jgi:hypothetical protein
MVCDLNLNFDIVVRLTLSLELQAHTAVKIFPRHTSLNGNRLHASRLLPWCVLPECGLEPLLFDWFHHMFV